MKKFISTIILILFSSVYCFAGELYFVQNASKDGVLDVARNNFKSSGYTIKSNDPVYGIKTSKEAAVISESTNGGVYYYYNSTDDKTLNKNILKTVKNKGWSYKRLRDENILKSMTQTEVALKKSLSTEKKTYNFSDAQTTKSTAISGTNNSGSATVYNFGDDINAYKGYVVQIPVGTSFDVYLQTSVNTATVGKGDEVVAVLTKNWEYNGYVIAEQGSTVTGNVSKANSAGIAYRDGSVRFSFNQLKTPEGKVYNITTDDIEFKVDSTGKVGDAAGKVIGKAAIGALGGLIIGALFNREHLGQAVAIGAASGAAWGAGSAVMERGTDAEIPTYTQLTVTLTAPLNVVLSN